MRLTKQDAERIAKKLKAVRKTRRRAHDLCVVYCGDLRVAQFGIRRGSSKDAGHGHIPDNLGLSPRETRLLAECPLSREEYCAKAASKSGDG